MSDEAECSSPPCYLDEFERRRVTIYHNPACSKSRETLALIRAAGIEPRIIEYLKTPPSAGELAVIVGRLGITPEQLVRKGEAVFRQKYAGRQLSDGEWLEAMVTDPILIERPIVIGARGAVLGRPPENVRRVLG